MRWRDCTLGDVVRLQRGHDLPERLRVNGSVPVVSSAGITGWHSVSKAEAPGVVTGRYGTIGEVYFLDQSYWPLNTALYVVDFKGNLPKYVAYLLRAVLKNYQSEKAAVPGVDRNVLHGIRIRAANSDAQSRIVEILDAYDQAIENNRKRIALLEEAARLLYREWFVHLRFPGHAHANVADGIPSGWMRTEAGQVLKLQRGHDLPSSVRIPGDVPVVSSSGITGFHDQAKAQAPGVVTGRYGTLGEVYLLDVDYWPLNTALYVVDFKGNDPLFVYYVLKFLLRGIDTQKAAVPGLDRNVLHKLPLLWPPPSLIAAFLDIVRDQHRQINVLTAMNAKLAQARDLLLPRLMRGDLVV